jgi:alkylated DNA repair dioxygenase AlkB
VAGSVESIQGGTVMDDLFADFQDRQLPFKLPSEPSYSAQWNEHLQGFDVQVPDGALFYSEAFFDRAVSDQYMDYFLENDKDDWRAIDWRSTESSRLSNIRFSHIEWQHDKLHMYGKEVYLPRYSAWYGDDDKSYTYSGLTLQPKGWNTGLRYLRDRLNEVANVRFNSVLMNWYRDGDDHISWHTDAESELGLNPVIGSLNFGESRDFALRRKDRSAKLIVPLKHGTLLIMKDSLQHHWEHAVPKRPAVKGSRVNLTFRVIKC